MYSFAITCAPAFYKLGEGEKKYSNLLHYYTTYLPFHFIYLKIWSQLHFNFLTCTSFIPIISHSTLEITKHLRRLSQTNINKSFCLLSKWMQILLLTDFCKEMKATKHASGKYVFIVPQLQNLADLKIQFYYDTHTKQKPKLKHLHPSFVLTKTWNSILNPLKRFQVCKWLLCSLRICYGKHEKKCFLDKESNPKALLFCSAKALTQLPSPYYEKVPEGRNFLPRSKKCIKSSGISTLQALHGCLNWNLVHDKEHIPENC